MKITCPSCGCSGDEELFGADMEWRRALTHALKLPSDCGPLAGRYVKLFAPLKRNLSSARACKLLGEVSELILAEDITFDRVTHRIPSHVWAMSLQIMLDKQDLQRPMPNHNYLIKVAIGQLTRRTDIEQHDRAADRRTHEPSRIRSGGMQPISDVLPSGPVLPELPADDRDQWINKAHDVFVKDGMHKNFIIGPLLEQRARELYAESLDHD
jgi:hypothetical protein